jgi:hypothetical protein
MSQAGTQLLHFALSPGSAQKYIRASEPPSRAGGPQRAWHNLANFKMAPTFESPPPESLSYGAIAAEWPGHTI